MKKGGFNHSLFVRGKEVRKICGRKGYEIMRKISKYISFLLSALMLISGSTFLAGAVCDTNCGSIKSVNCSAVSCKNLKDILGKTGCGKNCGISDLLSACKGFCPPESCSTDKACKTAGKCVSKTAGKCTSDCKVKADTKKASAKKTTKSKTKTTAKSKTTSKSASKQTSKSTSKSASKSTSKSSQPKASTPSSAAKASDSAEFKTAYEDKVISLVNEERAKNGLSPLTKDSGAVKVAHVRAKEIVKSFSHTRPDGSSCFTAASEQGVTYRSAGENIAYGYSSPEQVVTGWMNSDGHRKNILSSSFSKIGVGCYESAGTLYWSQFFIG